MKKLKDLCIDVLLNEGENVNFSISPKNILRVLDVNFNKKEDYIKITLETSFGQDVFLVVKPEFFNKWVTLNTDKFKDIFYNFSLNFLANSKQKESEEGLNEIIDDDGNIMPDQDMPNNSTNSMVVSPKFDAEKIFKTSIPKNTRFYSGSSGSGFISW